uniref:Uncharacterized protein n=1 Tax=Rhizophora mucronata TaxID=61149 RepID=A0A2P2JMR5_RHIMU
MFLLKIADLNLFSCLYRNSLVFLLFVNRDVDKKSGGLRTRCFGVFI